MCWELNEDDKTIIIIIIINNKTIITFSQVMYWPRPVVRGVGEDLGRTGGSSQAARSDDYHSG